MNNHKQNSLWGLMGWLCASLFYAYHNAIIAALTIASDDLMTTYDISNTHYGLLSVFYTISYAAMQIPVGIALDHYPIKKLLSGAIGVFALGCIIMSLGTSYPLLLVTRFIMGAAAAFAVLAAFKISAEWFSANHFATLAGLTVSLGYFGGIASNSMLVWLRDSYALSSIFLGLGAFGALLTGISIVFVSNYTPLAENTRTFAHIANDLKEVCCNRLSLVLIAYAMLMFTPLQVFKDSLGIMFFKSYYGYSLETATSVMNSLLFASILAAPILGAVSDHMGKRGPIIVLSPIILLLCFGLLLLKIENISFINNVVLCTIFTALFGFMTWGFLLAYSVFKETHKPHIVSTGLGLMNSINMVGGIVSVPLITATIDLLPAYQPTMALDQVYFYAFLILPLIIICSIPLLRHIPETNCRQIHD